MKPMGLIYLLFLDNQSRRHTHKHDWSGWSWLDIMNKTLSCQQAETRPHTLIYTAESVHVQRHPQIRCAINDVAPVHSTHIQKVCLCICCCHGWILSFTSCCNGAIMAVGSGMGVMLFRGAGIQSEWCHCIRAIMAGVATARPSLYRCYMNKKSFLPEEVLLPTAQFHLRSCLKAKDAFMWKERFLLNILNPFCDFERLKNYLSHTWWQAMFCIPQTESTSHRAKISRWVCTRFHKITPHLYI